METLQVSLGTRSYPIYIGENLLSQINLLKVHIRGKSVCIVTNDTVAPLYLDRVVSLLSDDYQCESVILPDGEEHKNLAVLNQVFDHLLAAKLTRQVTLIALGGGVIGDMTGFAAACYQRGVDFIQIPTTLLSQVDSSVGGKTAVNHALGKNMIGAFYQPQCVVIDIETLATLDDRQFASGMAEVIKYGLINDVDFFEWIEVNIDGLVARDADLLAYAIARSCQDKADIVAEDEREQGKRALLNLGHTFGHAIETGMGYGQVLHGEAIAIGMMMAADLSQRLGWLSAEAVDRMGDVFLAAHLPVLVPSGMTAEQFMHLMAVDKKVQDGNIRLVLMKALGQAVISDDYGADNLAATLAYFEQ